MIFMIMIHFKYFEKIKIKKIINILLILQSILMKFDTLCNNAFQDILLVT
jgi:hypothetical protein